MAMDPRYTEAKALEAVEAAAGGLIGRHERG